LSWDESSRTLTIGARTGSYPGIPAHQVFRVLWVTANHGAGPDLSTQTDRELTYTGQEVQVKAP
jgi:alpha-D-xyloside xylohydrolase